jgi:hypothetical protein
VSELVTVTFTVSYRIYSGVRRLPQDQGFLDLGRCELSGAGWTAISEAFRGFVIVEEGKDPVRIHVTRVSYVPASGQEKLICLTYDRSQMLAGDLLFVAQYLKIEGKQRDEPPPWLGDLERWLTSF